MSAYEHAAICHELNDLYLNKNADYGDSYHETYRDEGWAAFRIRLTDKLNRFRTLTRDPANVKYESIRDTLLDLANYAILAIMELDRDSESRRILDSIAKTTFSDKLSEQESFIASILDAKYISRDYDPDAEVDFWRDMPELDDMIYYCAEDGTRGLASIDAEVIHTRLRPGDCIHICD